VTSRIVWPASLDIDGQINPFGFTTALMMAECTCIKTRFAMCLVPGLAMRGEFQTLNGDDDGGMVTRLVLGRFTAPRVMQGEAVRAGEIARHFCAWRLHFSGR
jgi:hypothetical protein